jgi:hypothetical protein
VTTRPFGEPVERREDARLLTGGVLAVYVPLSPLDVFEMLHP